MTFSYTVNGKPVTEEELGKVRITKKDYIDFMEAYKRKVIISTKDKNE
ncbi:MAG: hypothetical protein ACI4FX_05665 [Agathobacter sp.]